MKNDKRTGNKRLNKYTNLNILQLSLIWAVERISTRIKQLGT